VLETQSDPFKVLAGIQAEVQAAGAAIVRLIEDQAPAVRTYDRQQVGVSLIPSDCLPTEASTCQRERKGFVDVLHYSILNG
jgi:hypothetical protein